ncbi:MAG: hypothetical protein ACT4TC_10910 [Myxococcaceae bacterium]
MPAPPTPAQPSAPADEWGGLAAGPLPATAFAQLKLEIEGWYALPETVPLKSRWGIEEADRKRASLVVLTTDPYMALQWEAMSLRLPGREERIQAVGQVSMDEAGRQLSGPAQRERYSTGLRHRIAYIFQEPAGGVTRALLIAPQGSIGVLEKSRSRPAISWSPSPKIEVLGLDILKRASTGLTRWGLLVRYTWAEELPGVSPRAPRLVEGGWDPQPGAALKLTGAGQLVSLDRLPPPGEPLTVLWLCDTGPGFKPEGVWPGNADLADDSRRWAWSPREEVLPLPSVAPVRNLSASARRLAAAVDMFESGVP